MSGDSNVVRLPSRPLPKYGEAHVSAGEYQAAFAGCETWARCHKWAPRLVMVFTLIEPMGVSVPGYYRVAKLHGRPRRNGWFEIGSKSRLYRELARMLGHRPPTDHVPADALQGIYRIVVRDVTTDATDKPISGAEYSVVEWVKGRI